MLRVRGLRSSYGRIEALHSVTFEVTQGEIVALVGSNGAGKTTLLRALSGVQPITGGTIEFRGATIDGLPPHERVIRGLAHVPEGRQIFAPLTVEDNLRLGAWTRRGKICNDLERVYQLFPILAEFRNRPAGSLSGGQQQMLAIGRALMSHPKMLLLDEPSMGLAPILTEQIFSILRNVRKAGVTILVVEQNVQSVLRIADRGYALERGHITLHGTGSELLVDRRVREAYLGL